MHNYTMNTIGSYIQEHYCPSTMNKCQLEELYYWSKVMKNLLEADKDYNIIVSMEEGHSEEEMEIDEFITRAAKMYKSADQSTRQMIKTELMRVVQ